MEIRDGEFEILEFNRRWFSINLWNWRIEKSL